MSIDTNDSDLGLAHLDPVEPPADVWDAALSVAVDPATPAPEDDLVPDPDSPATDPVDDLSGAGTPALDDDEIDLSEFDDEPDAAAPPVADTDDPAPLDGTVEDEFSSTFPDNGAGTDPAAYDDGADQQFDYGTDAGDPDAGTDLGGYDDVSDLGL